MNIVWTGRSEEELNMWWTSCHEELALLCKPKMEQGLPRSRKGASPVPSEQSWWWSWNIPKAILQKRLMQVVSSAYVTSADINFQI